MHEVPLDVCTADTQGAIGYELQQALQNELYHRGIAHNVATVITQVLVDIDDPAFKNPTKPIGEFLSETEARQRVKDYGWSVTEEPGKGWRRVVASPIPREIVELETVKRLLEPGTLVITVGGGGIPVIDVGQGEYRGTAAVIDKDLAASLLATQLNADLFLIATNVDHVALHYGSAAQTRIKEASLDELERYVSEGIHFGKGSMAPKIEAVIRYLRNGGRKAIITSLDQIGMAIKGKAGSRFYA
jgi:carbamate kinase